MFESGSESQRDGNGRWTLRAALAAGEDSAIARVVIDKAKAGDAAAARFVLRLLCSRPRGRTITLALPAATPAGDVMTVFDATLAALAVGKITPDEALTVTRVLDWRLRALKNHLLDAERRDWAKPRAAARADATKPSPRGPFDKRSGGQGEGVSPANTLHPDEPPHPPIAGAMGPSLLSACRRARGGRGDDALATGSPLSSPLHSACIPPASADAPAVPTRPRSG